MIDVILALGMMFGMGFFIATFVGGLLADELMEIKRLWLSGIIISVVCFVWLLIGCNAVKDIETKYYEISTTKENVQVIYTDDKLENVNKIFGKIAEPNQVVEVSTIKNSFRGGVLFVVDKPKYKLVDRKEEKKNEK